MKDKVDLFRSLIRTVVPVFTLFCHAAWGAEGTDPPAADAPAKPYVPQVAGPSDEAKQAIRSFQVPAGLVVEPFAAEPHLANPVAFCVDSKGVFYVAETFRLHAGVTDTRGHMNWLDDDLACRTVADRVAMYKKYLGDSFATYSVHHDRVRRIVDTNGDGRADQATVFADGFNDAATGIGAGVLARKDDVWFACIPGLWKLTDHDRDGRAEKRELLHDGYGVHVGFLGHDLHGLCFGPDGRLYFSIGDRGFNVTTREGKTLAVLDTGSVLRCEPDGSGLEVFASGLRNPQELAFDEFGNLFTADNNSDSGDKARWVYLVEGGDSGWRIGYQFIESPISRGPWNEEKLWDPDHAREAAYIVPPIANISDGPSGLAYDPGVTALSPEFRRHFFLADFRGSSGQSGIRTFAVEPSGASFKLKNPRQLVWSVLATDVDFGPDGGLYFSDWVNGWEMTGKGRIYRVLDAARRTAPDVLEVKKLLAEGLTSRTINGLAALLDHPDMRVRQEARFELASRGDQGWETFARIAASPGHTVPRLHAVWGLEQLHRKERRGDQSQFWKTIEPLLADRDPEVRAQAAKVVGEAREAKAFGPLLRLLEDASPRVRFFAAIAVGKLKRPEAAGPLLAMVRSGGQADHYLLHAGVMGLAGSGKSDAWKSAMHDNSRVVRTAVLVAMRRTSDPEIAGFLSDADPSVVLEAARAINDVPIEGALASLADLALGSRSSLPLARRVLNANFRLGGSGHADKLADIAAQADLPDGARALAIEMLGEWAKPSGRDHVVGLWRPIAARSAAPAADAVRTKISAILSATAPKAIVSAAIAATAALEIKEAGKELKIVAADPKRDDEIRAEALKSLDRLNDPGRIDAAQQALLLPGTHSRTEALRVLAKVDPAAALVPVRERLARGSIAEQQGAIEVLTTLRSDAAGKELAQWLDRLIAGKVPAELELDLLEAAGKRSEPEIRQKVDKYQASKPKGDAVAANRELLSGGDPLRGLSIFVSKAEVECLRCHRIRSQNGESMGGEVGPELSGVGAREKPNYLLESIMNPDKQIAQGFESVVVATSDGKVHTGVFRGENDAEVRLITALGKLISVPKETIEDRKRGPSAMPSDLAKKLSKKELRDLVAFLATLKTVPKSP